jgi:[ribosomal protein S5]-alanine N-acetyltransferase
VRVETPRLTLTAAGIADVEADLEGPAALAERLQAVVPPSWPPELYDRRAMEFARCYLRDNLVGRQWTFWYMLLRHGTEGTTAIGICGFKGAPSQDGTVEIGYSVLGDYQRCGYASEAVAALVAFAFGHAEVQRVAAETMPDLTPSKRVLQKNGFHQVGPGHEAGAIRYVVERPDPP